MLRVVFSCFSPCGERKLIEMGQRVGLVRATLQILGSMGRGVFVGPFHTFILNLNLGGLPSLTLVKNSYFRKCTTCKSGHIQ